MELKCAINHVSKRRQLGLQSHLYGIEIYLKKLKLNFWEGLQSHLYGIEIFWSKYLACWTSYSNRTFMELKFLSLLSTFQNWSYSNRTFMELKFCKTRLELQSNEVLQSHLYGIEIISLATFFVLKLQLQSHLYGIEMCNGDSNFPLFARLQSHLYGIEILRNQNDLQPNKKLQSHLYGIEIVWVKTFYFEAFLTPIAPLWNWNTE